MSMPAEAAAPLPTRAPMQLAGGWELSLLALMVLLYLMGAALNPAFFGSADAFHAVLRDTARYGVMGFPTLILFQDGQPVKQIIGARPKASLLREFAPYLG